MIVPLGVATRTPSAQTSSGASPADYWSEAAAELAEKIVARAAPQTTLALTVRNASSLSDDDVARIRRALRSELRSRKIRLATNNETRPEVQVTLSENLEGFLWVAEIQTGSSHDVAMVTVARPPPDAVSPPAEPLVIRKTPVYQQRDPMLDVVPLASPQAEGSGPGASPAVAARLLVLGLAAVSLYEKAARAGSAGLSDAVDSTWQLKASMPFSPFRPWPRDARGRLVVRTNNQFDVYLPGGKCTGTVEPPGIECQQLEEFWPLGAVGPTGPTSPAAYFTPDRSFFDGRIRLGDGREIKAPPFFSAAAVPVSPALPRPDSPTGTAHAGVIPDAAGGTTSAEGGPATSAPPAGSYRRYDQGTSALLLLSGLDERVQLIDSDGTSIANIGGLGSDIVGLQTGCRSGWQFLASATGDRDEPDAAQAYELVNHKAVVASTSVEFPGPVTALWLLSNGSEAMAIARNLKTEEYEAYRLSLACGQ